MANLLVQDLVIPAVDETKKPSYTPALVSLAVLYFMMGFITCLNDTLVPFFKKGFTLNYAQSSLVQFYFFLTYGIMSIPAGQIVERVGYKNGMVLGFSVAAFGALLFFPASLLHQYYLFLAALFILAIGIVLLQVAANPYITMLGPERTASSRLTFIQGVGSIGTTLAPLFGAYFILSGLTEPGSSSDTVGHPYLAIAALLIIIAIIVAWSKLPNIRTGIHTPGKQIPGKRETVFSFRNLNLGALAIFFYVGAEVSIGTFLTNYISDHLNIPVKEASNYVSLYWGSMLIARFILGALIIKFIRPQAMLAFCALVAIILIGISVSSTGNTAVWTMISVGLCNSVMFAIIFSLSVKGLGKYTTRASGILSSAIVGGAIISFLQGFLIDHFNWSIAFILPIICYAYIIFYGINGYRAKKQ
ncbi:MAG: sugar MFS transporter [Ferruginibacter sp.]